MISNALKCVSGWGSDPACVVISKFLERNSKAKNLGDQLIHGRCDKSRLRRSPNYLIAKGFTPSALATHYFTPILPRQN